MLSNALESIEDFHNDIYLTIICPTDVKNKLDNFEFGQKLEVKLLENKTNDSSFSNQINLGIEDCSTEWFSILEIDEEFKNVWLSSVNEYIKNNPTVDVFLPIVKDKNTIEQNFSKEGYKQIQSFEKIKK